MKSIANQKQELINILLFVVISIFPIMIYGQNQEIEALKKRHAEIRAKIKRAEDSIKNKRAHVTSTNKSINADEQIKPTTLSQMQIDQIDNAIDKSINIFSYTVAVNVESTSDQVFERECTKIMSQGDAAIPKGADVLVVKSCKRERGKLIASYFMETSDEVFKEWNSDLQTISEKQKQKQELQNELKKIRNTKQMYQDMIAALEKELAANGIDVVDKGLGVVVKNVEFDGIAGEEMKKALDYAKDKSIQEARKRFGLENRKPIKNETAEFFEGAISISEKILSFVPGGDMVTNYYLWRLYSNSPDLGRMLGNGAACIRIYARIDELRKELNALEERERILYNTIGGTTNEF